MSFSVLLTHDAEDDLEQLFEYIHRNDGPDKAEHVLQQLEKGFRSLAASPLRGVYPKELLALGIREYREVFFKPYRIVYRVLENSAVVILIADGRRDLQLLLQRRLFQA